MSLTAVEIIAIVKAGGSVDIDPSGAVRISPAAAKANRAERNRRYYERRLKTTESVLKATETTESVLIQTLPSPPSLPPTPPNPAPTPVQGQERAPTREAAELFPADSKPVPPHKRITWSPATGWTGILASDRQTFNKAAPACDIDRQLSAADLWLRANPAKSRKANFYRFFVNWIARQQERGGDTQSTKPHGNDRSPSRPTVTRNVEPLRPDRPSLNATAVGFGQDRLEDVCGPRLDENGIECW